MIKMIEFDEKYGQRVVDPVVGIQRGEFGVDNTAAEQPDPASIPEFYRTGNGNFRIALKDVGNKEVAPRKMFVDTGAFAARNPASPNVCRKIRSTGQSAAALQPSISERPTLFGQPTGFTKKTAFGKSTRTASRAFPRIVQDTRFYELRLSAAAGYFSGRV